MKKVLLSVLASLILVASVEANDCQYWIAKVDPAVKFRGEDLDETKEKNIISGIECLLKLEGEKRIGRFYGSKPDVSQVVPQATVEIDALYAISEMYYGNDNFASAIALVENDKDFNSPETIKMAFFFYRKWFEMLKVIGLREARRLNLDPLLGSHISWY